MKVTISYIPSETREADMISRFVLSILPGTKVRESDRHPPFKHIYLATRKAGKPCDSKENP